MGEDVSSGSFSVVNAGTGGASPSDDDGNAGFASHPPTRPPAASGAADGAGVDERDGKSESDNASNEGSRLMLSDVEAPSSRRAEGGL